MLLVGLYGGCLQFADAGGVHEIGGIAVNGVAGFEAVEVMAGVERDPFLLGNAGAARGPGFISEFEQDADGAYGVDAGIAKIGGGIKLAVHPDTGAAVAAGFAGSIEISALAVLLVIIVHHVPIIDDQFGGVFAPDIHGAGSKRLLGPGFEFLAIHAVGDAVVLPGEIVAALADEAAVGLVVFDAGELAVAGGEQEDAGLARSEIRLKEEFFVLTVIVGIDGLNEQILVGTFGADVDFACVLEGEHGVELGDREDDGFGGAREIDGVANRDVGAGRGSEAGSERENQGASRPAPVDNRSAGY